MSQARDEEVLTRAFEQARPRLRALLKLYRVAPEDAEDLLQEAILALWRKRSAVEDFEAWLVSAARVECLRHRRRVVRQIRSYRQLDNFRHWVRRDPRCLRVVPEQRHRRLDGQRPPAKLIWRTRRVVLAVVRNPA